MAGPVTLILEKTAFVALFRPLVGSEDLLADLLLEAATDWIRREFLEAGLTLDESSAEVKLVIRDAVAAVLRAGDYAGYSSFTITTDDSTESRTFANPSAALDFTDAYRLRLGLPISASPVGNFLDCDY